MSPECIPNVSEDIQREKKNLEDEEDQNVLKVAKRPNHFYLLTPRSVEEAPDPEVVGRDCSSTLNIERKCHGYLNASLKKLATHRESLKHVQFLLIENCFH
jgi:hypothetical protein